jgi:hypothetical protein
MLTVTVTFPSETARGLVSMLTLPIASSRSMNAAMFCAAISAFRNSLSSRYCRPDDSGIELAEERFDFPDGGVFIPDLNRHINDRSLDGY